MVLRPSLLFALPVLAGVGLFFQRFDEPSVQIPPHVLSGASAFLLLPPQPVIGDRVQSMSWSPTGEYLALIKITSEDANAIKSAIAGSEFEPKRERSLVIYDVKNKKSTTLWTGQQAKGMISEPMWLTGSNRFFVILDEKLRTVDPNHPNPSQQSLLVIDAGRGTSDTVLKVEQEGGFPMLDVNPSPADESAILTIDRTLGSAAMPPTAASGTLTAPAAAPTQSEHYILRRSGELVGPLKFPTSVRFTGWKSPDGAPVFMSWKRGPDGRRMQDLVSVDPASGKLESITNFMEWQPKGTAAPVDAVIVEGDKHTRPITGNAWLVSSNEDSRAEIAAEASNIELSPRYNAVAYISNGVALVRPLLQVPKSSFLKAVVEAERQRAMMDAKMSGLAALMYGADYDDVLPGQNFTISDILAPYMKDRAALDKLVYTFQGGNLSDVKDPANTELGYISGPGGRAIIYVDGHVIWKPDK